MRLIATSARRFNSRGQARLLLAGSIAIWLMGCHHLVRGRSPAPDPALVAERVYAFMLCQECSGGERANVVALGGGAVPLLRSTLISGPPPDHVALLKQRLSTRSNPVTTPPPSAGAVALQLADFDAMYRVRAVSALGAIGGVSAREALCAGRATPGMRPNLYPKIDSAITRVGGSCP